MASQYSLVSFLAAIVAAISLYPSAAWAEKTSGFYVGGGVGGSRAMDLKDACDTTLPGLGVAVSSCDDKTVAWKGFGGYQFIRYFGVELGYYDLGKPKVRANVGGVEVEARARAWGPYAGIVVTAPLIDRLRFIARGGVLHWRGEFDIDAAGRNIGQSENGFTAAWGIGLEYMFGDTFGLRAEYERFEGVGEDPIRTKVDMISISGVFRF